MQDDSAILQPLSISRQSPAPWREPPVGESFRCPPVDKSFSPWSQIGTKPVTSLNSGLLPFLFSFSDLAPPFPHLLFLF